MPSEFEKTLKVSIFNEDSRNPELIGDCTIDLYDLYRTHEYDNWFDLRYKEKPAGEVYLELTFYYEGPPRIPPHPPLESAESGASVDGNHVGLRAKAPRLLPVMQQAPLVYPPAYPSVEDTQARRGGQIQTPSYGGMADAMYQMSIAGAPNQVYHSPAIGGHTLPLPPQRPKYPSSDYYELPDPHAPAPDIPDAVYHSLVIPSAQGGPLPLLPHPPMDFSSREQAHQHGQSQSQSGPRYRETWDGQREQYREPVLPPGDLRRSLGDHQCDADNHGNGRQDDEDSGDELEYPQREAQRMRYDRYHDQDPYESSKAQVVEPLLDPRHGSPYEIPNTPKIYSPHPEYPAGYQHQNCIADDPHPQGRPPLPRVPTHQPSRSQPISLQPGRRDLQSHSRPTSRLPTYASQQQPVLAPQTYAMTPAEYEVAQMKPANKRREDPPQRPAKIPLGLTQREYELLYS